MVCWDIFCVVYGLAVPLQHIFPDQIALLSFVQGRPLKGVEVGQTLCDIELPPGNPQNSL